MIVCFYVTVWLNWDMYKLYVTTNLKTAGSLGPSFLWPCTWLSLCRKCWFWEQLGPSVKSKTTFNLHLFLNFALVLLQLLSWSWRKKNKNKKHWKPTKQIFLFPQDKQQWLKKKKADFVCSCCSDRLLSISLLLVKIIFPIQRLSI